MNAHFERGLLLYQQSRHVPAEVEFKAALVEEPENATAHAYLALNYLEMNRLDDAEREADEALRCEPNEALCHSVLGRVRLKRNRPAEAEVDASEALRLCPWDADTHGLLAAIRFERRDFHGALAAAEDGLAYDPHHSMSSTLRTMALVHVGRRGDALQETQDALHRHPDNDLTHTARGWALLHENRPKEALPAFREALRLDPSSEWARNGMIEAMKAQYRPYRLLLAFFLWMTRIGLKYQFVVLMAMIVAQQILGSLAQRKSADAYVFAVLYWLLFAFVILTLIAKPLFNLTLMTNRFGRNVLTKTEKVQACVIGVMVVLIIAAVLSLIGLTLIWQLIATGFAIGLGLTFMPLTSAFRLAGWPRWVMYGLFAAMIVALGASLGSLYEADQCFDDALEVESRITDELTIESKRLLRSTSNHYVRIAKDLMMTSVRCRDWLLGFAIASMILSNVFVVVRLRR